MKMAPSWAATLATFLVVACGESSFSGGSGGRQMPTANTDDAKPETIGDESPDGAGGGETGGENGEENSTGNAQDCAENPQDRTQVRLLTDAVKNNAANQLVRYELSLVDCEGNPKPIPRAPLLFDINAQATFDLNAQKLPFVIQNASGESIASGKMNLIQGSDLFGVKGSNYFHWRIDEFSFDNADKKLYLNVDVSNLGWQPFNQQERTGNTYTFATYLRIGDADPVEQKVKWTN